VFTPKKIIVALTAVLAILIIVFFSFQLNQNKALVKKVSDWEGVKQYQYGKTPGLERAEQLQLTRELDMKVAVPGTDLSLEFHQIWYNKEYVYIFYSMDMPTYKKEADEQPSVSFKVKGIGEEADEQSSYTLNWSPLEGVYYKGRLYGRATTRPLLGADQKKLDKINQIELTDLTVMMGDKKISLPKVKLDALNYDAANEVAEKITIDQSHTVLDRTIKLSRLEMGPSLNRLYYGFNSGRANDRLWNVQLLVRTDTGETRQGFLQVSTDSGGGYVEFAPFNKRPGSVTVELQTIRLFNKVDYLQFTIDATKFSKYVNNADDSYIDKRNQELLYLHHTKIQLEELIYNKSGIYFTIAYKQDKGMEEPYLLLHPETPTSLYGGMDAEGLSAFKQTTPMWVQMVNERNETAELGGSGNGSGARFSGQIPASFVKKSKQITISIHNLITEINTDWKTSITIPSGK